MKYNFESVHNRYGTNSIKYDFAKERGKPEGVLPMWVADMDFPAPKEVLEDIQKAVNHGIFGYSETKEDYHKALVNWFESRFDYSFTQEEVIKTPGIVFALAQIICAFTKPNDSVMIQTPVYYPFYDVIRENNRRIVKNSLIYDDGKYSIDFADFEKKIKSENVKMFILCSPHNPVGRVWTQEELERLSAICKANNVLVVSDEIHCDFVYENYKHTCYGTIDESAIVATAPSKTFNLAGLQVSNIIVKNADLRGRLAAEIHRTGYSQLNTLGLVACQSAYAHGGEWLSQLLEHLKGNVEYIKTFLENNLPKVKLVEPQGTYLIWLDFSAYGLSQDELDKRITNGANLWLSSGPTFGEEGNGFQRINIACPRKTLEEALKRLAEELKK